MLNQIYSENTIVFSRVLEYPITGLYRLDLTTMPTVNPACFPALAFWLVLVGIPWNSRLALWSGLIGFDQNLMKTWMTRVNAIEMKSNSLMRHFHTRNLQTGPCTGSIVVRDRRQDSIARLQILLVIFIFCFLTIWFFCPLYIMREEHLK